MTYILASDRETVKITVNGGTPESPMAGITLEPKRKGPDGAISCLFLVQRTSPWPADDAVVKAAWDRKHAKSLPEKSASRETWKDLIAAGGMKFQASQLKIGRKIIEGMLRIQNYLALRNEKDFGYRALLIGLEAEIRNNTGEYYEATYKIDESGSLPTVTRILAGSKIIIPPKPADESSEEGLSARARILECTGNTLRVELKSKGDLLLFDPTRYIAPHFTYFGGTALSFEKSPYALNIRERLRKHARDVLAQLDEYREKIKVSEPKMEEYLNSIKRITAIKFF